MHPLEKAAVFILLLATLIFVHELGHFLVAKLFRVKVVRFSLGFGPRILGFTWGETEYRIAALPLGGYVKMAGDDPTEPPSPADRGRGFLEQPPWKRSLIALAGPGMSLLFPVLVYFIAFYYKGTELSSRLGRVEPDRPAYAAGLRAGDRIVAVDGVPVRYFDELRDLISPKWERPVAVTYERAGAAATVSVVPERVEESNLLENEVRGVIGVSPTAAAAVVGVADPASPAARAGLQSFDRVVALDGQPIATWADLNERLEAARGPVRLRVVRDDPPPEKPPKKAAAATPPRSQTLDVAVAPAIAAGGVCRGEFGLESSELYVYAMEPGSPAFEVGLRRGDRLLSVDGTPLQSWSNLERLRQDGGERPLRVAWIHEGERLERLVQQRREIDTDAFDNKTPVLRFGAQRDLRLSSFVEGEKIPFHTTVSAALVRAARVVPQEASKVVVAIGMLVTNRLSVKNIGGPIMMYEVAVRSAELGWEYFLQMMGFISINLGLMNLIPIPVLDGFHVLSAGFETVRRRPLGMRARVIATYVGLVLLVGLMLLALRNDIVAFILN